MSMPSPAQPITFILFYRYHLSTAWQRWSKCSKAQAPILLTRCCLLLNIIFNGNAEMDVFRLALLNPRAPLPMWNHKKHIMRNRPQMPGWNELLMTMKGHQRSTAPLPDQISCMMRLPLMMFGGNCRSEWWCRMYGIGISASNSCGHRLFVPFVGIVRLRRSFASNQFEACYGKRAETPQHVYRASL